MHARISPEKSLTITWPLVGSLLLTAVAVAFVCAPPMAPVHSVGRVFTLATMYLLAAGTVHALAVWGICQVREESRGSGVWPVVWAAWVAIVWLPLIALLTKEHSPWVAAVLPVTAAFATVLLARRPADAEGDIFAESRTGLLNAAEMPLWQVPSAAIAASVALQLGIAMLVVQHDWTAGSLLSVVAIYTLARWKERTIVERESTRWGRTSAGNSMLVWMLLVLALVPFTATFVASALGEVLGVKTHGTRALASGSHAIGSFRGFSGIVLVTPHKAHEVVVPVSVIAGGMAEKSRKIEFDGTYWYFNDWMTQPAPDARVAEGDPIHNKVFSTNNDPLVMEAHQKLKKPISLSCCQSLRVDVANAHNREGPIVLEVFVRDTSVKGSGALSLGAEILPSSLVSPMPPNRGTVEDHVTFQLSRAAIKAKGFNEITVKMKTARSEAMKGVKVSIEDFELQR